MRGSSRWSEDDNVWLDQRRAEHAALTQLLSIMDANPGRAMPGAGCSAAATGPVPLTLDTSRARRPTVSDDRARRSAVLNAAAKAKSQAKTSAAEHAIRALVKRGEPITFRAVSREATVSHAFLYAHQDLRRRIQHLLAPGPTRPGAAPAD